MNLEEGSTELGLREGLSKIYKHLKHTTMLKKNEVAYNIFLILALLCCLFPMRYTEYEQTAKKFGSDEKVQGVRVSPPQFIFQDYETGQLHIPSLIIMLLGSMLVSVLIQEIYYKIFKKKDLKLDSKLQE